MSFSVTPNVELHRDAAGRVHHLNHPNEPYLRVRDDEGPRALADRYLRDVAPVYGWDDRLVSLEAEPHATSDAGPFLEFAGLKTMMGTTTVSYAEIYQGLRIWEAGAAVTLADRPLRVVASTGTVHTDIDLHEGLEGTEISPDNVTPVLVARLLGLTREEKATRTTRGRRRGDEDDSAGIRVNSASMLIYRYNPDQRIDPESTIRSDRPLSSGPPTLDLPPLPEGVTPGRHYVVTEVLFDHTIRDWGDLHWRAFFERSSGAVLYLRALVACANGLVYVTDPMTAAGGPLPAGPLPQLNALRTLVEIPDVPPQTGGVPVSLSGRFAQLVDFSPPPAAPPTENFGHFDYNVNTTNFSAVNAYVHVEGLFRLMESMGFTVADYFDDTSFNPGFPVPVDHAGFGNAVNAMAPGNSTGTGSGGFIFGLAAAGTTVGIADDPRVVAHEFCHALLWDSVNSPNFGFAHSAGDSIGAILNAPGSQAPDPFVTFPWINIGRRQDRSVAAGWAWGGVNDTGGYQSEQILCTTHFRAYRSTGGDAAELAAAQLAARYLVYLIIRGIGSLATSPITPTPNPAVWASALINADAGTVRFDDQRGGCLGKVVRWSFEQQGLYQPPGAPVPVVTPGAPPPVDVYIDDGRGGQYSYQPHFWENTSVWNRLAPDGRPDHQTPRGGIPNYAYVRVSNRGTTDATNLVVRGYHCRPGMGLVWPDDWTAMTTDAISVPGPVPAGGHLVVGPFAWTPEHGGHECLFMSVSAAGDLANTDPATFLPCAAGPTPIWRLVPFDNNLAQRSLVPVPGGGGREDLVEAFRDRELWVGNPFDHPAQVQISVELPALLATRGWQATFREAGASEFTLGPRASRCLRPRLTDGADFTAVDVTSAGNPAIRLQALIDGLPIGGITYLLDPELTEPAQEHHEPDNDDEEDGRCDPDREEGHHHSQRHRRCCCHCDCPGAHHRGRSSACDHCGHEERRDNCHHAHEQSRHRL